MVNQGDPRSIKDQIRISGNVVLISGQSVAVTGIQISGVTIEISGESVYVFTSGNSLSVQTVSNQYVSISGVIGQSISGGSQSGMVVWGQGASGQMWVQTAGTDFVAVSGVVSLASGSKTNISGAVVWGYGTSGQFPVQTVSGSYVSVTGTVSLASGSQTNISGQPVFVYLSSEVEISSIDQSWSISGLDMKISSNVQGLVVFSGNVVSQPTYLNRVVLHLSSTQNTSSEFAVYHNSFIGAGTYSVKIFSQNMSGHQDVVYLPDAPYLFFPGACISEQFTNSGALSLIMTIIYETNP
jgi:hypothetical protein